MRYHYERPLHYVSMYGETYECNHPIYNKSTLYKTDDKGLAVIQQRYDPDTKHTWWEQIDPWLTDELYFHPKFKQLLQENAKKPKKGLYPTMTIRQVMWALRMKPLKRKVWETMFDTRNT